MEKNPAKQLSLVVYPIFYMVFYIQTVVGLEISEASTISTVEFEISWDPKYFLGCKQYSNITSHTPPKINGWNLEMMVKPIGISFSKGPPFSGEPCLFWGVYIL